jgi:hypothetical protein
MVEFLSTRDRRKFAARGDSFARSISECFLIGGKNPTGQPTPLKSGLHLICSLDPDHQWIDD